MNDETYIAHIRADGTVQTVKEHSENTARLAREMSIDELKDICYQIGLLHDAGKYQPSFQKRIKTQDRSLRVEHSVCGAKICEKKYEKSLALIMSLCIAGHHSGIPDCGSFADSADDSTLSGRMKREFEDILQFEKDIKLSELDGNVFKRYLMQDCQEPDDIGNIKLRKNLLEKFSFFTRYCFSCLTDADSLDTARFMNGELGKTLEADFEKCLEITQKKLSSFTCNTDLQKVRAILQKQVYDKTHMASEIYLMNMPTGSGKTLCSLRFALERAIASGKKRIIYIIPYNSIIEQTARLFDNMFGGHARILRHQSTFSYEDEPDLDEDYRITAKHASENWDAHIIITTSVQFFESVYSNKRSKLRKLHNTADSILIFDEAHLMPTTYLQPCLLAVAYITKYLRSEAVFLTATMPDFGNMIKKYALHNSVVTELITDKSIFSKFVKCRYCYKGVIGDEVLLEQAGKHPSSLIVVNKKSVAKELYKLCGGKKFHLSTYMTPFDRINVIDKIGQELASLEADYPDGRNVPPERRITVISTSLIEAGVDLDFNTVFRELSGLDSILQAGGRCNREGKRENAEVFVFEREEQCRHITGDVKTLIVKGIIREFDDISSAGAIAAYYDRLFQCKKDDVIKNSISGMCNTILNLPFETYSRLIRLIDDSQTVSIAVERDNTSRKLIEEIRQTGIARTRRLQKYCCSVCNKEFDELLQQSAVNDYGSGVYCLVNNEYYSAETGIRFCGNDKIL